LTGLVNGRPGAAAAGVATAVSAVAIAMTSASNRARLFSRRDVLPIARTPAIEAARIAL
jgi:hypothetical protein